MGDKRVDKPRKVNNPNGNPPTLVARQYGNQVAYVHGLFSAKQELTPEAEAVADAIMTLPHTMPADRLGAERVGMLLAQIGRIEKALADGRVENRQRAPRMLIEYHRRLHAELREWLDAFGLTPRGRATFVRTISGGSLAEEIRRRLEEMMEKETTA